MRLETAKQKNTAESLEARENKEQIEVSEREKTPEEIRQENIDRLTVRAKEFIAERKAEKQEAEARKKLEEIKEKIEPEEKEEEIPENIEDIPVEEQKGFIGRLKDKYRLWKLQRAGLADPEKALEFFNYVNNKQGDNPYKLNGYVLGKIKDTFALTSDPIAFYEKIKQIKKRDDKGFIEPHGLGKLMGEPDILAKLDLWQSSNELIGCNPGGYLDELELKSFFGKTELHSKLSGENVERIKRLRNMVGLYFRLDDLDWLIDLVEDDKIYNYVGRFLNTSYRDKIKSGSGLGSLVYELKLLEADGLVESVLAGAEMGLDVGRTLYDLTSGYDKTKQESMESIKSLGLEELSQDESFRTFADDFLSLAGKDFEIKEYDRLVALYRYHKDYALAFAEAFSDLGIIQGTDKGMVDIKRFEDILGHWANKSKATAPEVFFAILDPKFQEIVLWMKESKRNFTTEKIFHFAYNYAERPEIMAQLETEDGKELFVLLTQMNIDPFSQRELFSYPGLGTTLKMCDKVMNISNSEYISSRLIELNKTPELRDELIDFLEKNDFKKGEKFSADENVIKYLIRLLEVYKRYPDGFDLEAFKKDFDFFYGYQILHIIENDPAKAKEVFALSHKGLLNNRNLYEFFRTEIGRIDGSENTKKYFEEVDDILLSMDDLSPNEFKRLSEIPKEERQDYLDYLKKIRTFNLWEPLKSHIFEKVLEKNDAGDRQEYLRRVESVIVDIKSFNEDQLNLSLDQIDIIIAKPDEIRGEFVDVLKQLNVALNETISKRIIAEKIFEAEDFQELWVEIKKFLELLENSAINSTINVESYLIQRFLDSERVESVEEIIERAKRTIEINQQTQQFAREFSGLIDGNESGGLSKEQLSYFQNFAEKYKVGDKGKTIVSLVATREIRRLLESEDGFSWEEMIRNTQQELAKYQEIIEKNSFNNIPQGIKSTIGMEYEITETIKNGYEENNLVSYKSNIMDLSNYSKIGQGADAVHEIATQATDNPYLMLLEMKLLQDLEYIDFNFRPIKEGGYYGAGTGYHLSLGGENGIKVDSNSCFLNNMMMMNNWAGANFEQEVTSVKVIRDRDYDSQNVLLLENTTPSIETKNFAIDRWEPFERTVLTCYNSAIAIQAVERYTLVETYKQVASLSENFPMSPNELYLALAEKDLIKRAIDDPVVKELIFTWLKLQVDVLRAVEDHNENFLTNETEGYLDETGLWVDAKEISGRDNQRYFEEGLRNYERSKETMEPFSSLEEFFKQKLKINSEKIFNRPDRQNANAITCVGNLFLTKFSNFSSGKDNEKKKADPNVLAFLTNTRENGVKNEKRNPDDVEKSVFDRNGELPEDYYYLQGGSEKLIIHQTQKLFIEFNKKMADLLKSENSSAEKGDLAVAA